MQSTRNKLIELLSKHQETYISGQLLSEKLNISRSAIWKHMKELEKDGYQIEGKPKRGYRILKYPEKISENTIKWGLNTEWIAKTIIHKTKIHSTQQIAHQLAQEGAKHGTVIIADEQTHGKGRMNREWHSAKDEGIWMSLILRPEIPPHKAPQLTLLTATVLADVISKITSLNPHIKWPNDIIIDQKKVSGILTEMQAEQDQIQYIIIGIGMNVNQKKDSFHKDIRNKATSLKIEAKKTFDIRLVIQEILKQFEKTYDVYLESGFSVIKKIWESYGFRLGEKISIKTAKHQWDATFSGIDYDGGLFVRNISDGKIQKLYSGEIDWFRDDSASS